MKKYFLLSLAIFVLLSLTAQNKNPEDDIVIISKAGKTSVKVEDGKLTVQVEPKDARKFKSAGLVRYSDFGAKADGKTDDIDAIAATHAYANQQGLKVVANKKAHYYISGKERTAVIKTNTDFLDFLKSLY